MNIKNVLFTMGIVFIFVGITLAVAETGECSGEKDITRPSGDGYERCTMDCVNNRFTEPQDCNKIITPTTETKTQAPIREQKDYTTPTVIIGIAIIIAVIIIISWMKNKRNIEKRDR